MDPDAPYISDSGLLVVQMDLTTTILVSVYVVVFLVVVCVLTQVYTACKCGCFTARLLYGCCQRGMDGCQCNKDRDGDPIESWDNVELVCPC